MFVVFFVSIHVLSSCLQLNLTNIVNVKNVIVPFPIGTNIFLSNFYYDSSVVLFSITDVIHDVGEIRTNLLIESSQISCACFRCGDQNQLKTLTFKQ